MGNDPFSKILADVFANLIPEMMLLGTACLLYLGGTLRASRNLWSGLSLAAVLIALVTTLLGKPPGQLSAEAIFAGPLVADHLAYLIKVIALGAGVVLVLFSWNEVPENQTADHQGCLLIVIAGLSLVGSANDLITLFLALELISIPSYILLYLPQHDEAAQEAAMKYFLLSIFSSALMLFGFSYLYGLTGTTNISAILHTLNESPDSDMPALASVALIMVVAGLGARITAVPFHFYAPDVYQGAPTVVAALLAFVQKAAGFVALLRVLGFVLPQGIHARDDYIGMALSEQTPILLWFLAVSTMVLGNLMGLLQDNVKRLLAYSGVAHAGYMLIALAVALYLRQAAGDDAGPDAVEALLYYLVAYGAMTVGAFAVLSYLSSPQRPLDNIDDLAGLSRTHPVIALFMAVFLFSLAGIPLTAGFMAKFLVFFGAMGVPDQAAQHATLFRVLAVVGVVNAAIGAWYYLRIVAVMYLRTSLQPLDNQRSWPGLAALWLCLLLTVGLSVPPASNWLLKAAHQAAGERTGAGP